ncbi:CLUMA_CG015573, isoform A [Clunio marinus]|uniref:CLUMA_CG015573, isoform A n=1 Tax=Clunio marinus TaxID=568069 RepID=A0A1J1IPF1_9DIPT|nr:CLUMA_CG015573, isoform A [Clunio marinus]
MKTFSNANGQDLYEYLSGNPAVLKFSHSMQANNEFKRNLLRLENSRELRSKFYEIPQNLEQ